MESVVIAPEETHEKEIAREFRTSKLSKLPSIS
jgi:hypothetical protein